MRRGAGAIAPSFLGSAHLCSPLLCTKCRALQAPRAHNGARGCAESTHMSTIRSSTGTRCAPKLLGLIARVVTSSGYKWLSCFKERSRLWKHFTNLLYAPHRSVTCAASASQAASPDTERAGSSGRGIEYTTYEANAWAALFRQSGTRCTHASHLSFTSKAPH